MAHEYFFDGRSHDHLAGDAQHNLIQVHLVTSQGQRYDVLGVPADRPFIHGLASSIGTNVRREFYTESVNLQLRIYYWINEMRRMRFFDWSLDAIRQPSLPGQDVLSDNGRNLSSVL